MNDSNISGRIDLPSLEQVLAILPQPTPKNLIKRVQDAHQFAEEMHGNNRRNSGELYIEHDRAVARAVGEIGIDINTTTAGMLHDSLVVPLLESDKATRELRERFGNDVIHILQGLNRILPYSMGHESESDTQLEKLRRAILHAIDDDIRILLVRMGDSVEDLLVANSLPDAQRLAIAREASQIYAPIANRLGIWSMKWRLEDESFRHLRPEIYDELSHQLAEQRQELDEKFNSRVRQLQSKLEEHNIKATVKGRTKHIFSIYKKMKRKGIPFEEIFDLRAMRIILEDNDITRCYQVLGVVHHMWLPIPEEFDDYIANPKPNGYQSLHTAVYDEVGDVLEVQIRTRAMDDSAERGIAAHWAYKEGGKPSSELTKRVSWLRQLLIDIRDEGDPGVPADQRMINIDDLSKRIYVFTPQRDLIELPDGGTPIDFAYQIHTEVGHRCRGAKVNGKMVPLNYQLRAGDTVSIITAKRGGPSRDWMSETAGYTKSAKTRSKVRQWFRVHDREENILRGMDLVERELKRQKMNRFLSIEDLREFFKEKSDEDLLAKVGFGDVQYSQVTGAITLLGNKHLAAEKVEEKAEEDRPPPPPRPKSRKRSNRLEIQGLSGLQHRIANCCMPIPPEKIVGFITRGRGVTVHKRDCPQFLKKISDEPERIIEVSWNRDAEDEGHEVPLQVTAYRRSALSEDIATLVSGRKITLKRNKSSTNKRGVTTVHLIVHVETSDDLEWLMGKLRTMANVMEVRRQRWRG